MVKRRTLICRSLFDLVPFSRWVDSVEGRFPNSVLNLSEVPRETLITKSRSTPSWRGNRELKL